MSDHNWNFVELWHIFMFVCLLSDCYLQSSNVVLLKLAYQEVKKAIKKS